MRVGTLLLIVVLFISCSGPKLKTSDVNKALNAIASGDATTLSAEMRNGFPGTYFNDISGQVSDTPVHEAAYSGHTDVLRILLEHGLNVDLKTTTAVTPLMLAATADRAETMTLLLQNGANVNAADDHGATALVFAAQGGHLAIIRQLLRAGANINGDSPVGTTPLENAAGNGQMEAVKLLVSEGAAIALYDPAMIRQYGHAAIADFLLKSMNPALARAARKWNGPSSAHRIPNR